MSNMSPCLNLLTPLTLAHALKLAAGKSADDAFEFQCQQHRRCAFRRQAAALAHRIEVHRIETERVEQRVCAARWCSAGRAVASPGDGHCAELFQNVLAAFGKFRPLFK